MNINVGQVLSTIAVENIVAKKKFLKLGRKTTVCHLTTRDGFEVVGLSFCADPSSYTDDIGQECAYRDALQKLVEDEAYFQSCENWLKAQRSEIS